ncbi:MAG TPA: MATE family efflux transporter [Candidatus Ornithospirochaeta stercorigallinarum]|nr:MATE family efflux transporter [Candidatus Ornithospirochaeta stercorigallinarum]
MNKDLTEGRVAPILIKFALPLLLSMVFQQLYNIADSLVAGKFISEEALAAVGNSYEITLIFIAFAFGCNMGTSILVSQFFGAKRYDDVRLAITTSYISTFVLVVVLTICGILGTDGLLSLINTPQEIFADSALYLDIYIYGLVFLFFYNLATGVFSALGDSRTPFVFLAISSTANIFMDILFVTAFSMGVDGVAWATFICQGVSCILANAVLVKRISSMTKSLEKGRLFDSRMFFKFIYLAVPSILQQSFVSVGNILVQTIINSFGSAVIAGYSAAIKLNNLVITSTTTLANAVSSFTSQNIGAAKYNRVVSGWRVGIAFTECMLIPIILLFTLGADLVLRIFLDDVSSLAMATGRSFLLIVAPFYLVVAIKNISDAVLRGAGDMKPFMADTFIDLLLRVGLSWLFSSYWGTVGIWLSWPVGWSVATVISIFFYLSGHWKKRIVA